LPREDRRLRSPAVGPGHRARQKVFWPLQPFKSDERRGTQMRPAKLLPKPQPLGAREETGLICRVCSAIRRGTGSGSGPRPGKAAPRCPKHGVRYRSTRLPGEIHAPRGPIGTAAYKSAARAEIEDTGSSPAGLPVLVGKSSSRRRAATYSGRLRLLTRSKPPNGDSARRAKPWFRTWL
jgi:hypothetical protein